MARVIIWSERALNDLDGIAAYIAQDSEFYAKSVVRTILRKTRLLSNFPFIGRLVPEFNQEAIREIFAYSYRIVYKVEDEEIKVAAVIHGRRLLEIALQP